VLGKVALDEMVIGAGEVAAHITKFIDDKPYLKYGLVALDVAAGPAAFAVREMIAASPVGQALEQGQEKVFSFIEKQYKSVGRSDVQSTQAAGGAVTLGTLGVGGAVAALRALKKVDFNTNLEGKLRAQFKADYDNWAASMNDPRLVALPGDQRHHIFPLTDRSNGLDKAAQKIDTWGININDPVLNGVALPNTSKSPNPYNKVTHNKTQTNVYKRYVATQILEAKTPEQATFFLNKLRNDLLNNKRPWETGK